MAGMPDWPNHTTQVHLQDQLEAAQNQIEVLEESFADLSSAAMEDEGWRRLTSAAEQEFDRSGLEQISSTCRVMAVASPLIKRGLQLRIGYIWGEGVQVSARDKDIDEVIRNFWEDESNAAAFTSSRAQEENERALGTDGNFFLACFTNQVTGRVQVRSTPFAEIKDIILNPEDRDDPWFYLREYSTQITEAGYLSTRTRWETRRVLHPALTHRPRTRPKTIDGLPVEWDAPILHLPVNRLDGWKFGVPDAYAALPWARAYEGFLTDWSKLVKALSRFAWRLQSDKPGKARRAAQAAQTSASGVPPIGGGGSDAGQMAAYGPGAQLEAIPKTGATIDSESGRPLASLIAAGLGLPVTTLLADPGMTGARAVAETLDQPTILEMGMRRRAWETTMRSLLNYVIMQAVKAPRGPLRGTVVWDRINDQELIQVAGDPDTSIMIDWPDLDSENMKDLIESIVNADSTGKLPPKETARLLLSTLGVRDVEEVLEQMLDEDGEWIDPTASAAQAAVAAFRRGEDPAEATR